MIFLTPSNVECRPSKAYQKTIENFKSIYISRYYCKTYIFNKNYVLDEVTIQMKSEYRHIVSYLFGNVYYHNLMTMKESFTFCVLLQYLHN